jgi:hypothetical protein
VVQPTPTLPLPHFLNICLQKWQIDAKQFRVISIQVRPSIGGCG